MYYTFTSPLDGDEFHGAVLVFTHFYGNYFACGESRLHFRVHPASESGQHIANFASLSRLQTCVVGRDCSTFNFDNDNIYYCIIIIQ